MSDITSTYGGGSRSLRDRIPTQPLLTVGLGAVVVIAVLLGGMWAIDGLATGDDPEEMESDLEATDTPTNSTEDASSTASVGISITQSETDDAYAANVYVYRMSGVDTVTITSNAIDDPIAIDSFGSETITGLSVGDTITVSWGSGADETSQTYTIEDTAEGEDTELDPDRTDD